LEYAILIAVVISGLIIMQGYIKRGVQGRFRSSTDDIGEQYSPGQVTSAFTSTTRRQTTETVSGGTTRTDVSAQTQHRTGQETLTDLASEDWPE